MPVYRSVLAFSFIEDTDSGEYFCKASNLNGSATSMYPFNIVVRPGNFFVLCMNTCMGC